MTTIQSPPTTPKQNNISGKTHNFQESATSLIQSLEDAFVNMTDLTQQAEQDADEARRNAKLAMEIARKYTTRNYVSNNEYADFFLQNNHKQDGEEKEPIEEQSLPQTTSSVPQSIENVQQSQSQSNASSSQQSHEILTLTLELERTKQALQNVTQDLRSHQKLVTELRQTVTLKDEEISNLNTQVQIAEEDANMAMEIAKQNSDKREEMEGFLHKALTEITNLKQQGKELVCIQETDEEEEEPENNQKEKMSTNTIVTMQQPNKNTTAIERGRGILHLYRTGNTIQNKKTTLSKFQNIMQQNDETFMMKNQHQLTKSTSTTPSYYETNLVFKKLKESSEKLNILLPKVSKDVMIDNIISSYCLCVERKMVSQMERIQELDSYCCLLEKSIRCNSIMEVDE